MESMMKELDRNEMELAAGGTVPEFAQILEAATHNPTVKVINMVGGYVPSANSMFKPAIEKMLSMMGIKAEISLGFGGTGLFSEANRYWRNGERISHQDVLNTIKHWSDRLNA